MFSDCSAPGNTLEWSPPVDNQVFFTAGTSPFQSSVRGFSFVVASRGIRIGRAAWRASITPGKRFRAFIFEGNSVTQSHSSNVIFTSGTKQSVVFDPQVRLTSGTNAILSFQILDLGSDPPGTYVGRQSIRGGAWQPTGAVGTLMRDVRNLFTDASSSSPLRPTSEVRTARSIKI